MPEWGPGAGGVGGWWGEVSWGNNFAREIHAHKMHAYEMPAHKMHAYKVPTHKMNAHKIQRL